MNEHYEIVPNIISCKDLDYLSDMFNWNYGAFKQTFNDSNKVNDFEIKDLINKARDLFCSTMKETLNILNKGGNNE